MDLSNITKTEYQELAISFALRLCEGDKTQAYDLIEKEYITQIKKDKIKYCNKCELNPIWKGTQQHRNYWGLYCKACEDKENELLESYKSYVYNFKGDNFVSYTKWLKYIKIIERDIISK